MIDETILARIENIHETLLVLIPVVLAETRTTASSAHITHRIVRSNLNASVELFCDSDGTPLSLCFWERTCNGQTGVTTIDDDVIENEGKTGFDGIFHKGKGLKGRDCGFEIRTFSSQDIGLWKCSLVTEGGDMLTGTITLVRNERPAHVIPVKIHAPLDGKAVFSCESDTKPLRSCEWTWTTNGQRQVAVIDMDGAHAPVDGIKFSSGGDLMDGKCRVSIESVREYHVGNWTCALVVADDGEVFTGAVKLSSEPELAIYIPTSGSGIQKLSLETSQVTTMWNSTESLNGIAFDTAKNALYWTSGSKLYSATIHQTEPVALLSTGEYGSMHGLAYDWIAENVYIATGQGHIVACSDDARATKELRCRTLIGGEGNLSGIVVDPNEGFIYYSRYTNDPNLHCVLRAGTDGAGATGIVMGSRGAFGVQIDFESRRLYWAEYWENRIRSSNLDGSDLVTLISETFSPYGIAHLGQKIYWGQHFSGEIRSTSKSGTEIGHEATVGAKMKHLVAPNWNPPRNRVNPCEQQVCSGVCVLSRTSFECLP